MGLYVVYGTEPYCIDFLKAKLRKSVKNEMNFSRYDGEFTEEVAGCCRTFPMLDTCRVIFLSCASLKDLDNKAFSSYLESPCSSTQLLIMVKDVDKRLKVYKALDKAGAIKAYDKLSDPAKVMQVVDRELTAAGAVMASDAKEEFMCRMDYINNDDMNLLILTGHLKTLCAISKDITLDMVNAYTPVYEVPNVFALAGMIQKKDIDALLHQASMISDDAVIGTLSLIMREFRISYKALYFSLKDIGAFRNCFQGVGAEALRNCIGILEDNMAAIKCGNEDNSTALKQSLVQLCAAL
jgi:DNA polymerase-3 subunit delta